MNKKTSNHPFKRIGIILLGIMGAYGIATIPIGIPFSAQTMLAITFVSMLFWITEVFPLHATALLVGVLLILFGGFNIDQVFASYFDRVVVLVLGGFVLASALSKHKLDDYLSQKLLGKFGSSPRMVLLGVLLVTAGISLWISNSAAAALSLPIVLVILKSHKLVPGKSNFSKSMVIAVAYGATIGGIGTLIGSTPNVITQKFLTNAGISFGFMDWTIRGLPFAGILLILTWIILQFLYPSELKKVKTTPHPHPFTNEQKMVGIIFLSTVLLWVTESIHGIPNSVVAIFPIILLSLFRLVTPEDFNKIGWDSLILIGGGIALGLGIENSGLSAWLANQLGTILSNQSIPIILLLLGIIGVGLTSFLSNTAASAIFIPIITSLAATIGIDPTNLVVAAGVGVSLDFLFPMGTPPTAIAYSTGYIHTTDLLKSGILVSLAGTILLSIMGYLVW